MKAEFICHKDFSAERPKNMFHKESVPADLAEKDEIFFASNVE